MAGLARLGYERVEQVRERGQFAVRGGIVDVYPSTGDPVRAEFWGDTVESLRSFSVFSQRAVAEVDRRTVYAASEVDAEDPAFQTALQQEIAAWEREGRDDAPDEAYRRGELRALARLSPRFTDLGAIAERRALRLATIQPDEVVRALAGFEGELAATVPGEEARRRTFVPLLEARRQLSDALAVETVQREQRRRYPAARPQFAGRDVAAAERDLTRLVADGYRVFVVFRHPGEATRAAFRLKSLQARVLQDGEWRRPAEEAAAAAAAEGGDFDHASAPEPAAARPDEVLPPGLYFVSAPLREGFVSSELKLALVGERALLRAAPKGPRFAAGARLASFFDLRPGDYVVHEDHGVALFSGIETKTVAGVTRDYLFLRFKDEDKLYVPHDQIAKVTRYIGASGAAPALNRLGGNAWQAIKTRARRAVVEMAGELLNLYAARQAVAGFAYPVDGELTRRLEDAFPYEETEDQAEAIDDVKNDMEAPHPMDRLVCGDVGYGKTEVALRAAFKAAEAGKQTLMLVPTTILAEQHYLTFGERFSDFPVNVQMISRFRTTAESRKILKDFAEGRVDVLIGTHRLLSTDVVPARPGAGHRRRGAALRRAPEGGAAQPQAAGGRAQPVGDADPPHPADEPDRHPRHLGHRDAAARPPRGAHLHRRVPRRAGAGGDREGAGPRGPGLLPAQPGRDDRPRGRAGARPGRPRRASPSPTGRWPSASSRRSCSAFLAGEADVLVSTSIIESGLDIPTANTLIVERADMLGLAQLYQIRGRIGRSDEYAYAYLLYPERGVPDRRGGRPPDHAVATTPSSAPASRSPCATSRSAAPATCSATSSRGQVAAVGFEMYAQMLDDAVQELRGEAAPLAAPVRVEVPVSAYVPPEYIAYEATKIDVHRRIAAVDDEGRLEQLRLELADRFGPVPEPVENLMALQQARLLAARLGAAAVVARGGRLQVDGLRLGDEEAARLRAAHPGFVYFKQRAQLTAHPQAGDPPLPGFVTHVLRAIIQIRSAVTQTPERGHP